MDYTQRGTKPVTARAGLPVPRYQPLDWAQIRAPLLPIESYLDLDSGIDGWATNTQVRAALAVGSIHLSEALDRPALTAKRAARPTSKLLRYLIRMSTRPTPFGMFAGVGMISWADSTDIMLDGARPRTRTRPDMAWLLGLVEELEAQPAIRRRLSYFSHAAAFVHGGRIFLSQAPPDTDSLQRRPPVSVRSTAVVHKALDLARRGIAHQALVDNLADSPTATIERIETLIDGLRRQGFLLTDLRPPLTATNPADYVTARLRDIPEAHGAAEFLAETLAAMAAWDDNPLEDAAAFRRLPGTSHEPGRAIWTGVAPQVDMALSLGTRHVTRLVAIEAARAAELLLRLTPFPGGVPYLAAYRTRFEVKYGHDREVPLLELLHPDAGLGSPFVRTGETGEEARVIKARDLALLELAMTALRDRHLVLDLDDAAIGRIEGAEHTVAPVSIDLSVFVLTSSADALDAGDFKLMVGPNVGAIGAGKNLGRFVGLLGEPAKRAIGDVARQEAGRRPSVIHAESIYLPSSFHAANIAVREHARSHEVVFGATPGLDPDRIIPLDELVVGIRAGRFYLRWTAQDLEVEACAGHMLNNSEAPELVRFIEDAQLDGRAQFTSFDWGVASELPMLPRVQMGRIVLCPARWNIDAATRKDLDPGSPVVFASRLAAWRERWQVPRYVYLCSHDNRLLIDLEKPEQVNELRLDICAITDSARLLIEEALPAPDHAWLSGPDGRFIAELIVPLVTQDREEPPLPARSRSPARHTDDRADRLRPPGSDWLFAKIYCSPTFEEDVLIGLGAELLNDAVESGLVSDWFFVRYSDPDVHLRLRFTGDPARLAVELMPRFCSWGGELMRIGACSRFCFDTYDRELERYGGVDAMPVAEELFGTDSRTVLQMLNLATTGVLELDRVSLAVLSIDDLLHSLGLDEGARLAWCRDRIGPARLASQEYRRRKTTLRDLLGSREHLWRHPGGPALAGILKARHGEVSKIKQKLEALDRQGQPFQDKNLLYRSYIHMHCNRLLGRERSSEEQALALLARTRDSLAHAALI